MQSNEVSITGAQEPRRHMLLRRWPTALGVGVAALMLSDFDDGREFAIVLLLPSVGYLLIAVLERPRATWWVLIGLLGAVVCLRLLNLPPEPVLAAAAVAATIVGLVRGSLRRLCLPALQAPATMIFGGLAFVAVAAGSQIGGTLASRVVCGLGHLDRHRHPRSRLELIIESQVGEPRSGSPVWLRSLESS